MTHVTPPPAHRAPGDDQEQSVEVSGFPIEPGGPYSGCLSSAVASLPARPRGVLAETGGMAELLVTALWSAVRHPRGYWGDVREDMHFTIKRSWLSISVALAGFLLALGVPSMQFIQLAGIEEYYGPLLLVQSTRSFTVWVATLLVAGVIGASITAELGSRKVREELDAMRVMGIDPVRTMVVPRIVSITLITTLIAIPAEIITVLANQFATSYFGDMAAADYYYFVWDNVSTVEIIALLLNCFLAGLLVGAVCCYKGMAAEGGSMGLGRAVNQAVVISFVSLFVLQLGYNAVVLGLFPDLGGFR